MGLESFQARAFDFLAKESPSDVSTSPDRSLEHNENNGGLASVPAALLKDTVYESHNTTSRLLPALTLDEPAALVHIPSTVRAYGINHEKTSPQNMPQYRNVFNNRARMGFCYWTVERKAPACKAYSFGAYKTFLGLPKV